jgi:hypothetical protein
MIVEYKNQGIEDKTGSETQSSGSINEVPFQHTCGLLLPVGADVSGVLREHCLELNIKEKVLGVELFAYLKNATSTIRIRDIRKIADLPIACLVYT